MARLGSLAPGTPAALELLQPGSLWRLAAPINLYSRLGGSGLATQAAAGRCLEVLQPEQAVDRRLRVRLLEDGYPGWIEPCDLLGHARVTPRPRPQLLNAQAIAARLPRVMAFAEQARQCSNHYLWGGTLFHAERLCRGWRVDSPGCLSAGALLSAGGGAAWHLWPATSR